MILKGDICIGSGATVLQYRYDTVTKEHHAWPLEMGIHRFDKGIKSTVPGEIVNFLAKYREDRGCYSDGKVAALIRHLVG